MAGALLSERQSRLTGAILLGCMALAMLASVALQDGIRWLLSPVLAFAAVFALCIAAGAFLVLLSRMGVAFAGELVIVGVPLALPVAMFALMLAMAPALAEILPSVAESGMMPALAVCSILPVPVISIAFMVNRIVYYRKRNVPESRRNAAIALTYAALAVFAVSLLGAGLICGANAQGAPEGAVAASLLFLIVPLALNLFVTGDLLISFNPQYSGVIIMFLPVGYLAFALSGAMLGAAGFLLLG